MKAIELFAGSGSFRKIAEKYNIEVWSHDIIDGSNIDYCSDFLFFDIDDLPFIPNILWASPPCTAFSKASSGHHFTNEMVPKTYEAVTGLLLLKKTLSFIKQLQKQNPNLLWYIENPFGYMRKSVLMSSLEPFRKTITYCQYGYDFMKPTDIWTNDLNFQPKYCGYGKPCHTPTRRNTVLGISSLSKKKRSVVPGGLFESIFSNY